MKKKGKILKNLTRLDLRVYIALVDQYKKLFFKFLYGK